MSKLTSTASVEARSAISALLAHKPPVLVEVRFPHAGTSPDWYLLQDEEQLEQALGHLEAGAEVHISSVWDLKNTNGALRLTK